LTTIPQLFILQYGCDVDVAASNQSPMSFPNRLCQIAAMPWPLSQDFNEAVQDPRLCFADDELRAGAVVTNALGLPMPRSGNFADVYELRSVAGDRRWAVKCFTRPIAGQRERYAAVSDQLRQARLRFTVHFQYLEQGIRVAGRWYPILKMDWVDGLLLNEFVRNFLDRPAMLEALANRWVKLARRLRNAGIAHGDLQHGNVLLVPGRDEKHLALKLIDYDGMYVPALADVPSGELGHPSYQHPQRLREATYNADVDRFPLLVIYTAIRALTVGGRSLWERFDNGDNLLFCRQDFEAPTRSALFAELLKSDDPTVRFLAETLIDAARSPLEQVPPLDELAAGRRLKDTVIGGWLLAPAMVPAQRAAVAATPVAAAAPVATSSGGKASIRARWVLIVTVGFAAGAMTLLLAGGIGVLVAMATRSPSAEYGAITQVQKIQMMSPAMADGKAHAKKGTQPELKELNAPAAFKPASNDAKLPAAAKPEPKLRPDQVGNTKPWAALAQTFTNSVGMEFVLIPAGTSWLGGGGGKPGEKEVEIPRDFYLGKYLVTQEQWRAVMGINPSHFNAVPGVPSQDQKRFPVESVSWADAQVFLARLNQRDRRAGWVYRLPTEVEWEYACRGGPMSDKADVAFDYYLSEPTNKLAPTQANFEHGNGSLKRPCKVGSYSSNRLGLYDMHGNVWQWCHDSPMKWEALRILRGGSWTAEAVECSAANRSISPPFVRDNGTGLRLARVPAGE
jgi:formylglycine-generating enzyme required for sulfatase activity